MSEPDTVINGLSSLPTARGTKWTLAWGAFAGAASGAVVAWCMLASPALAVWRSDYIVESERELLPDTIILIRHGESEGNADHTLYRSKADNRIELTGKGSAQAVECGKRIKRSIIHAGQRVHMVVSPFYRTIQTARNIRLAFADQILHTYNEPRIREQEFGNLQGEEFNKLRQEQQKVGRFWYRFPTGESGADVYDRVQAWWESLMRINNRPSYEHDGCDVVVVVTHGLTMRLILMQLFGWSPNTFHTVWNAENCACYVLKKDLSRPGICPYVLDSVRGDVPRSSINVDVEFTDGSRRNSELSFPSSLSTISAVVMSASGPCLPAPTTPR